MLSRTAALALLAGALLAAPPAAAENQQKSLDQGGGSERPWAQGVPPAQQQKALALFQQGNALLKQSVFVQAAAKYREALALWDHPAIHFNMALALLNLDQPVELREHLLSAMRYGAAPLDQDKFDQAKSYQSLVEHQLAHLRVTCQEPGAVVTLDGKPLFTAPGNWDGFVRPGPHSVTAAKPGYVSDQLNKPLPPGEPTELALKLYTEEELTQYRRRWAAWIPWTVLGSGAAAAAIGGGLHYGAAQSFKSFDAGIQSCGGCVPSTALAQKRSQGNALQGVAFGGYALGGAALVTGAVLVYVNRLQPYRISPAGSPPAEGAPAEGQPAAKPEQPSVSLAPYFDFSGRRDGGLVAQLRF